MVFHYGQAERSYIYYIVYKGQKGAKKRTYIKANITSTCSITLYRHVGKVQAGKPLHTDT